jgi:hypothetical protein
MSLTALARLRLAGRMCRFGSRFILAVGLIVSICLFFAMTSDPGPNGPSPIQWLLSFAFPGIVVLFTSFFFILLFAVGAWLEYMSTHQDSQEKQRSQQTDRETKYEHVEITSLPR